MQNPSLNNHLSDLSGVGQRDYRTIANIILLAKADLALETPWSTDILRTRLIAAFETDPVPYSPAVKEAVIGRLTRATEVSESMLKDLEFAICLEKACANMPTRSHNYVI